MCYKFIITAVWRYVFEGSATHREIESSWFETKCQNTPSAVTLGLSYCFYLAVEAHHRSFDGLTVAEATGCIGCTYYRQPRQRSKLRLCCRLCKEGEWRGDFSFVQLADPQHDPQLP